MFRVPTTAASANGRKRGGDVRPGTMTPDRHSTSMSIDSVHSQQSSLSLSRRSHRRHSGLPSLKRMKYDDDARRFDELMRLAATYDDARRHGFTASVDDYRSLIRYAHRVATESTAAPTTFFPSSDAKQSPVPPSQSTFPLPLSHYVSCQENIVVIDDDNQPELPRKTSTVAQPTATISHPVAIKLVQSAPKFVSLYDKNRRWIQNLRKTLALFSRTDYSAPDAETPSYDKLLDKHAALDSKIDRQLASKQAKDNFPDLSDEARQKILIALAPENRNAILIDAFNQPITGTVLSCLLDGKWLNDEVINFYINLIMERHQQNPNDYPSIHCFNTFFYSSIRDHGYNKVRRWTRKVKLFDLDLVVLPVHLGSHWCCAAINFKLKRIEYYDSLHGNNPAAFRLLRSYLDEESKDKRQQPFDLSEWTDYCPKDIPAQQNGYDCGVFTCMFAEYTSRQEPFDFDQEHMPYLRNRIMYEILSKKLMIS